MLLLHALTQNLTIEPYHFLFVTFTLKKWRHHAIDNFASTERQIAFSVVLKRHQIIAQIIDNDLVPSDATLYLLELLLSILAIELGSVEIHRFHLQRVNVGYQAFPLFFKITESTLLQLSFVDYSLMLALYLINAISQLDALDLPFV